MMAHLYEILELVCRRWTELWRYARLPAASVVIFVSMGSTVFSAELVIMDDTVAKLPLGKYMECLEDPSGRLGILEVASGDKNWHMVKGSSVNFGFTSSAYWFRFGVVNTTGHDHEFALEINYPQIDQIDFYTGDPSGSWTAQSCGDGRPFDKRAVTDRNCVFPHVVRPGVHTYYLRIQTTGSLSFVPILWSPQAFFKQRETQIPILWAYAGYLLAMAIGNLLLFLFIREESYLHYALMLAVWIALDLTYSGLAFQHFWPHAVWWTNVSLPFFICLSHICIGLFCRAYLDIKSGYSRMHRLIQKAVIWPNIGAAVGIFFVPYTLGLEIAVGLDLLTALVLLIVGFDLYRQRSRPAKYFIISYTVVAAGAFLICLRTLGLLPANEASLYFIQIGAFFVTVVLSIGMAQGIQLMKIDLSALNRSLQRQHDEIQQLNSNLEHRVNERTAQLRAAIKALQESLQAVKLTQGQLVQSEKMAALGGLVAGVAHEINTPIGVGITAASLLYDKTKENEERYTAGELKRSEFEKYLRLSTESTQMVLSNLYRAADLVKSFKQVAADQSTEERRRFNFKTCIEELMFSLRPRLKKSGHKMMVSCPEHLEMDSYPGVFFQIITNLVMNSLIHGFENMENRQIQLDVDVLEDELTLNYSDNGQGMDSGTLNKAFDPFFTTKRNQGGTGLGMHIVYNLVTQTLKGTLVCNSAPGEGFWMGIHLPLSEHMARFEHAEAINA